MKTRTLLTVVAVCGIAIAIAMAIAQTRSNSQSDKALIDDLVLVNRMVASEEFAVLDRTGRLQLPQEYMDVLELERRVRLELEPDHIGVWPDKHHREQNGD